MKIEEAAPNIFLIVMDSARSDYFGCYGSIEGLTPNVDKLAKDSTICENFYASGSGSALSHTALFTGQHSTRTGVVHNLSEIKSDILGLPVILSQKKYRSYGHAKCIQPPVGYEDLFGFEELVYPQTNSAIKENVPIKKRLLDHLRRYPRVWTVVKSLFRYFFGAESILKQTAAHFDGRASLDYLFDKCKKKTSPLFLYSTILHPHTPYSPPKWAIEKVFKGEKVNPLAYIIQTDFHAWLNGDYGNVDHAIEDMRKLYKAELHYGDYLIGEFIEKLKDSGKYDDSILIITSDHGEAFGEHNQINHGSAVYDVVIKVPCIIKFPNNAIKKDIEKLCSHIDIVPTLINYLDINPPVSHIFDGEDIFKENIHRSLVIDAPPLVLPGRLDHYPVVQERESLFWRCLINLEFKFVWRSDGATMLYKRNDYEEEKNDISKKLKDLHDQMFNEMVQFYLNIDKSFDIDIYPINMGTTAAKFMTSPRIISELKKLGYL